MRIPVRSGGSIKLVWVRHLDRSSEYDFAVYRHTTRQTLEAPRSDRIASMGSKWP